jgi:hypothetical protein
MNELLPAPAGFRFRDLHPSLFMGTMSDRYAGWIGQIYTADRYGRRISRRTKKLRGRQFTEEVLPVESVAEYFTHFPVLEIDFTFYRPLLDREGKPTPNYHVLRTYRQHMKADDRVFLKVPQAVCARKLRRGGTHVPNPDYLDSGIYTEGFHAPAVEILGETLHGLIFEQEYQRKDDQSTPEGAAEEWDRFFDRIPPDPRRHLEIRTGRLLTRSLFDVLERHGVGQVLSHWTWLPALSTQMEKSGGGLPSEDGSLVVRLVTPRGKTYEETYSAAHPFDAMVEGMLHDGTVEETVEIIRGVVQRGSRLYLFINNRAGGNAPLIARRIAGEFMAGAD